MNDACYIVRDVTTCKIGSRRTGTANQAVWIAFKPSPTELDEDAIDLLRLGFEE
jgi:hypothetical protein